MVCRSFVLPVNLEQDALLGVPIGGVPTADADRLLGQVDAVPTGIYQILV